MKVVTVLGARPQFIKAATVSRMLEKTEGVNEVIIHTGQHFDENMSEIFFTQMQIPKPHYNLNINSLSHGAMTGRMIEKIEAVLLKENPDWVLVYGDTNSTIAGSLAAKKLHIKVAHVEAGLRSFNIKMPEEVNRILTDRISDLLFCPTETAVENLQKEGFENFNAEIVKCGDVMLDASIFYLNLSKQPDFVLPKKFVLATIHRPENTDVEERLLSIFSAFETISKQIPIILPLHPRTKKYLNQYGYKFESTNIIFVSPVGYLEMVHLLTKCSAVLTDSGGLQKEAFFFKKPGLTLRDESEWVELEKNGFNRVCGADYDKIVNSYNEIKEAMFDYNINLYGKGNASQIIVDKLLEIN